MFSKKKSSVVVNNATTTTIIGNETVVTGGVLSGQGSVRMDGQFTGEINIGGHLILGETGMVDGDTKSLSMLLAGKMIGNITCSGSLHMVSTGILKGNIEVGSLIVDEGAKFAGSCKITGGTDSFPEISDSKNTVQKLVASESAAPIASAPENAAAEIIHPESVVKEITPQESEALSGIFSSSDQDSNK